MATLVFSWNTTLEGNTIQSSSSLFLFLSVQSLPGVHIEGEQQLSEPPSQVCSPISGGALSSHPSQRRRKDFLFGVGTVSNEMNM